MIKLKLVPKTEKDFCYGCFYENKIECPGDVTDFCFEGYIYIEKG